MNQPDRLPDQSWNAVVEPAHPNEVEAYLIDEIFKAMGLRAKSLWRTWFGVLFTPIVTGFSHRAAAFDQQISQHGFRQSAQDWLKKWITRLQIVGSEHLPKQGPLLIAANHPGTYDGLAIASIVPRQDLRIIAAANPFFRALPNARRYFIYSTRDTYVRTATIRNAIRHLQAGGALLIFPSGRVDPDPLHFREAARQALTLWSGSLKLILSKVPQTNLVLAINSGFIAAEYFRNPFVRLQPDDERKQKLAEVFQVIQQVVFNRLISSQPGIIFGEPISSSTLSSGGEDFQSQIFKIASSLMDSIPSGG